MAAPMLLEEAQWLSLVLRDLKPRPDWTVLDIGSSTEYFRHMAQPYIDYYVFLPLRKAGARVLHVDAREDVGVDVVCDIAADQGEAALQSLQPADVVICSNLLEHVQDRDAVRRRLATLTREGGHLVVTVPHVYRHHPDPIDTGYRPSDRELAEVFVPLGFRAIQTTLLDVACGYVAVPAGPVGTLLFHLRRIMKRVILDQVMPSDRCQVAAVVLQKDSGAGERGGASGDR